jgi:hypothetical protein
VNVNNLHLCANPSKRILKMKNSSFQNLKSSIGDCPIGSKCIKMYELEGALQLKVSLQGDFTRFLVNSLVIMNNT